MRNDADRVVCGGGGAAATVEPALCDEAELLRPSRGGPDDAIIAFALLEQHRPPETIR